jgi:hypothetical protein
MAWLNAAWSDGCHPSISAPNCSGRGGGDGQRGVAGVATTETADLSCGGERRSWKMVYVIYTRFIFTRTVGVRGGGRAW